MALTRQQKQEIINDLKEKISRQKTMIFVDFTGLKVKDLFELRRRLRESNSLFKVSKRTLLKIVFKDFSSSLAQKIEELEGELGVIFGFGDEISVVKTTSDFSSENDKLKILGGFFEGKFVEKEMIIELGKISSKKELLSRLVGSISAPISNFVNVLESNIKGLVYVLSAINK